jgi:hypothetical protein
MHRSRKTPLGESKAQLITCSSPPTQGKPFSSIRFTWVVLLEPYCRVSKSKEVFCSVSHCKRQIGAVLATPRTTCKTGESGFAVELFFPNLLSTFCVAFFACRVVMAACCSVCCSTFLAQPSSCPRHDIFLILISLLHFYHGSIG